MKYGLLLGTAFATLLLGCSAGKEAPVPEEAASPPSQAIEQGADSTCPHGDFSSFLSEFSESDDVQRASIPLTLQIQSIDPAAEPEPRSITKQISAADLELPIFPNKEQQLADGLETRQSTADGEVMVTIFKADTDYQKSYFFGKDPCWKLVRIRDDSL